MADDRVSKMTKAMKKKRKRSGEATKNRQQAQLERRKREHNMTDEYTSTSNDTTETTKNTTDTIIDTYTDSNAVSEPPRSRRKLNSGDPLGVRQPLQQSDQVNKEQARVTPVPSKPVRTRRR